jgi:dUTP pyrophosphatase
MTEKPKAIQLKISLMGSDPLIWRRISVESDKDFYDLHDILQVAMGWENYHLFSFRVDDYTIKEIDEEFDDFGPGDSKSIDAGDITLHEALLKSGVGNFTYEYDFGDGWLHNINVEKVEDLNPEEVYPHCIDGEMNCPPEDCGGIPGYYRLLKILDDKKHPEHKQMKEWIGGDFDPKEFSVDKVNLTLTLNEEAHMEEFDDLDDDFYFDEEALADELMFGPLRINIVNKSAHPLPEYESGASAGMDLRANLDKKITLKPLERTIVKTGLFIELPVGFEAQVRPRSGLAAKHGITVLNAPGTIDADYRGEIGVILVNLSNEEYSIENGDRIAQMVIAPHERAEWFETDELGKTDRGEGGFGSTGKN